MGRGRPNRIKGGREGARETLAFFVLYFQVYHDVNCSAPAGPPGQDAGNSLKLWPKICIASFKLICLAFHQRYAKAQGTIFSKLFIYRGVLDYKNQTFQLYQKATVELFCHSQNYKL